MYKLYTLYIFVLYYYYVNYTIILTKLNYIQYIVEDGRALIKKYWKEIRIKTTRAKYGTGPFLSPPPYKVLPHPPILARQIRYTPTDIMTCFYVLITNMQKLNSL